MIFAQSKGGSEAAAHEYGQRRPSHVSSHSKRNGQQLMYIFAKNARIHKAERLSSVLSELENVCWDVVLFCETRAASGTSILENGATLYTSRGDLAVDGVGILIHAKHAPNVLKVTRFGGRLISLDLRLYSCTIRFLSIYCPHAGYPFDDFDDTLQQLQSSIEDARRHGYKYVVGGDFNAVLYHGDRGQLLADLVSRFSLRVAEHDAQIRSDDAWTFESNFRVRRDIGEGSMA